MEAKDFVVGKKYKGYVKLKFNYGLFVSVSGTEGLLHKRNIINSSEKEERKTKYKIGDEIKVELSNIEEKEGRNIISWTQ